MKCVITYKSKYGHAKRYAEELSRLTGADVMECSDDGDLKGYEALVHVGGIYAGIISGLRRAAKRAESAGVGKLFVVTVGMTSPADAGYYQKLADSARGGLPKSLKESAMFFNMRGGVDYKNLRGINKLIMKALVNSLKKTPEDKRTPENQAMIDTYGESVDLSDMNALKPVADALNA